MTDPLELLEALLWQMRRDCPNTADLLPNRAGDAKRAEAAKISGYADALEPIIAAMRGGAADDDTLTPADLLEEALEPYEWGPGGEPEGKPFKANGRDWEIG